LLLQQPADHIQLALECVLVGNVVAAADEDLPDDRLARLRRASQGGIVGGNVTPAEKLLALVADGLVEQPVDRLAPVLARRQEHHPHPVAAGVRQRQSELRAFGGEEGVRRLQEDAGTVAGFLLGSRRAPVLQVAEDPERLDDDVVRRAALDVDDESEAAGIVFERRVVEALSGRRSCFCHDYPYYVPSGPLSSYHKLAAA